MNEDEYVAKLNRIQRNIQSLNREKERIINKLKILEAEKEELQNDHNLKKIRNNKNNHEWMNKTFEWSDQIQEVLKEKFKFDDFRQKQLAAINGTLANRDVLLLMPTGGGKSLVYQLAAYVSKGLTLVVSPLISLIDDQLIALKEIGIGAATINGTSKKKEDIHQEMIKADSKLKLLYVTPEWIAKSKIFMNYLKKCYDRKLLARIVIDEVHCCSTWGHDFRPSYNNLGSFKKVFDGVPIIGLTATATMNILVDIQKMLCLDDVLLITAPFNRPNLRYKLVYKPEKSECIQLIAKWLNTKYKNMSGIIYATTVKETEDICNQLRQNGLKVKFYHADMESEVRKIVHERWIKNHYQVIIATVAFGMGIDKPDVRFVIHYSVPKSMENFYQESGRAGRDGQSADCILLFNLADYIKTVSMTSNLTEEANAESLLNYCLEQYKCRRFLIAEHFEDTWRETDCNNMCDHCAHPKSMNYFNIRAAADDLKNILEVANSKSVKVTLLKLMSAWFQNGNKEIRVPNMKKTKCSKKEAEHIIGYLLLKRYFIVEKGYNRYTTLGYIQKNKKVWNDTEKIIMPYTVDIGYPKIDQKESNGVVEIPTSRISTQSDTNGEPSTKIRKLE